MEKELLFPISIIILMILCIGVTSSIDFFNHDQETTMETHMYFPIPEGYTEGAMNNLGSFNYTNGNSSIFITQDDNLTVKDKVNKYTDYLEINNQKATVENYVVNDITIYKLINTNNTNIIHYWFVKDNKCYDVYTWDGNADIDTVVNNFVNT